MRSNRLVRIACGCTVLAILCGACKPSAPSAALVLSASQLEPRPMRYFRDDQRVMLREAGFIEASIHVPRPTKVALTITASGDGIGNVKPLMAVQFDRQLLGKVRVAAEPTPYQFQAIAEPGQSLLEIYLLNPAHDTASKSEINLTVHKVAVTFPTS